MTGSQQAQAMLRLLNGLARKGAYLDAVDGGYGLVMPGVARRRADATERLFDLAVVEAAARQGWIQAVSKHYRLTEAGALARHSGLASPLVRPAPSASGSQSTDLQRSPARPVRRATTLASHLMEAAERLAEDFQTGQMVPRVTSNWDRAALGALPDGGHPSGRGVDVSERISSAQERVRRALGDAGPEFADVLIELCCLETGVEAFETKRGWPRRSAKLVLGLALERLARHYGIVGSGPRHGRTQRWGERNYRPT